MKKLILAFLVLAASLQVNAQVYNMGIGLRGGGTANGITLKKSLSVFTMGDLIVSMHNEGIIATGLYEIEKPINELDGLYIYYGVGAHLGTYTNVDMALGLDAVLGLEFVIPDIPIGISLDIKPSFDFVGRTNFGNDFGALSIRYLF